MALGANAIVIPLPAGTRRPSGLALWPDLTMPMARADFPLKQHSNGRRCEGAGVRHGAAGAGHGAAGAGHGADAAAHGAAAAAHGAASAAAAAARACSVASAGVPRNEAHHVMVDRRPRLIAWWSISGTPGQPASARVPRPLEPALLKCMPFSSAFSWMGSTP